MERQGLGMGGMLMWKGKRFGSGIMGWYVVQDSGICLKSEG